MPEKTKQTIWVSDENVALLEPLREEVTFHQTAMDHHARAANRAMERMWAKIRELYPAVSSDEKWSYSWPKKSLIKTQEE